MRQNVIALAVMLLVNIPMIVFASNGFVDKHILDQYKGILINGISAKQMADEAANSTFTNERKLIEVNKQEAIWQQLVNKFNDAKAKEESCRHINGRDSLDIDSDPYDFIGGYSTYIHTLSFSDCNLHCVHSSIDGVNYHADAYEVRVEAYQELEAYREKVENHVIQAEINNTMWKLYGDEYRNKIKNGLIPFQNKLISDYQNDYDIINNSALEISCEAVVKTEEKEVPLLPSITYVKKERCSKTIKEHKFLVYFDDEGVIHNGCECKHPIFYHKIKFDKNNQAKLLFLKYCDATRPEGEKDTNYISNLRKEISLINKKNNIKSDDN